MTAPWVAIQRNPRSGSGARRVQLLELAAVLRRLGIRPRIYSRRERLAERLEIEAHRETLVCIVAAGGDGTIADVINRFPGTPIAILPLGTENLIARWLGIPRSGRFVAEMIAAGRTRWLDLGVLQSKPGPPDNAGSHTTADAASSPISRRFAIMASAGLDADVIHRLHASRTGNIRRASYLRPIWQSLRHYPQHAVRLSIDGRQAPLTGGLAVVANLPAYAMRLPVAGTAVGDDGLLDVRLFEGRSAFQILRYLYKVWRARHERLPDVHSLQTPRVRIESDEPVPVQCDGDPAGWTPAEIDILPRALEVYVPPALTTETRRYGEEAEGEQTK